MDELRALEKRIKDAKRTLEEAIETKEGFLTDKEVVELSQTLDNLLVEYAKMRKKD